MANDTTGRPDERIDAVLVMFDLDNTLADRAAAVEAWASEFIVSYGLSEEHRRWLIDIDGDGYTSRRLVFDAIAERFGLDDPDGLLAAYRRRAIELINLVSGAADCLVRLRAAGHRLAIVSNGSTEAQNAKVDRLGLRDLVDAVVVSETAGVSEPDGRIFELAAAAAGTEVDGTWMVGDSAVNDISGAQQLGLRTVWIARGRTWDDQLPRPDAITDHLHDVLHIISC